MIELNKKITKKSEHFNYNLYPISFSISPPRLTRPSPITHAAIAKDVA